MGVALLALLIACSGAAVATIPSSGGTRAFLERDEPFREGSYQLTARVAEDQAFSATKVTALYRMHKPHAVINVRSRLARDQ
jgi:hypothetical protein